MQAVLRAEKVHTSWSSSHEPQISVSSNDTLEVWTRDGFDGQMESVTDSELSRSLTCLDFGRIAPLTGPVWLDGAHPGDTVAVHIEELEPAGPGWTVIWPEWSASEYVRPPGVGPSARIFRFEREQLVSGAVQLAGVTVPIRPMLGMIGTAPAVGEFATLPPRRFGGNMDVRLACVGATLLLPVFVEGALVSFGDAHAAQGDGEVCGTGIECSMRALVRLELLRNKAIPEPQIIFDDQEHVTAFGTDLDEAAKRAILLMHQHLTNVRGLPPAEAFALLCYVYGEPRQERYRNMIESESLSDPVRNLIPAHRSGR